MLSLSDNLFYNNNTCIEHSSKSPYAINANKEWNSVGLTNGKKLRKRNEAKGEQSKKTKLVSLSRLPCNYD